MENKKKPQHLMLHKEKEKRYERVLNLIVMAAFVFAGMVWCLFGTLWGLVAIALVICSWEQYDTGAYKDNLSDNAVAYPKEGLKQMLKSWAWFAFLLAVFCFFIKIERTL